MAETVAKSDAGGLTRIPPKLSQVSHSESASFSDAWSEARRADPL